MDSKLDIESLFKEYHRDIYQFSLYFTNSVQDAEDITQETFLKAMRNMHSMNDATKVKYWLLSIAKFTAIDHFRKKQRKTLLPRIMEKMLPKDREQSLDEQIVQKEQWEEIQSALLQLKPHYRSLLILRGIKEMSIKETAEILQCTELKVRVDFHRAVKLLKQELHFQEGVEFDHEKGRFFNTRN